MVFTGVTALVVVIDLAIRSAAADPGAEVADVVKG